MSRHEVSEGTSGGVRQDAGYCVAVIAQQIYARHVQGLTSDPRFGALGAVVQALGRAAQHAAERGVV